VSETWTHGRWTVKAGREDEFVRAWREIADWTLEEFEGARGAKLVRDRESPNRFYSFGTWESAEAVARWRAHPSFDERISGIMEFVDELEPVTADVVEEVGELV
jgi:heme-degrading monooxygenase HmoA